MTFTPNIPLSGQSLGNSRTQVVNNFLNLRNAIQSDHADTNGSVPGRHNFSRYQLQASVPATSATERTIAALTSTSFPGFTYSNENGGPIWGFNLIKGSAIVTPGVTQNLIDLNSPLQPNFCGIIEARINTNTNLFAVSNPIYWFNGTPMLGYFCNFAVPPTAPTVISNASAPFNLAVNAGRLLLSGTVVQVSLTGAVYSNPNYTVTFTITQFIVPA